MTRFVFVATLLFCAPLARADVAVLTQHNDNARTGANLNETLLNTNNVNAHRFGLLFWRAVDDEVYAQPLIMTNVDLGTNGIHNIVVVTTANDSVYAFDADDPSVVAPYWMVNFLGPNIVPPNRTNFIGGDAGPCFFFTGDGNLGIIGTPVIDPVSGTLYLVARTREMSAAATNYVQRLHALDLGTGAERPGSPVIIAASLPATNNYDATNGVINFDPFTQNQRPGLALVNGVVYIGWASQCDYYKYHGWVMGYDAATLQQVSVYIDTPNGSEGGIWMAGAAPAADAEGNLYLATGNGTLGDGITNVDRGESFLKLTPNGTNLTVSSWFTPFNWSALNSNDSDLGSAGMLLIPGTDEALSGGKQGVAYLVNRDAMGGLSLTNANTNVLQSFVVATNTGMYGSAVWWDGPDGSYAYVWPGQSSLQQYEYDWTNQVLLLPSYAKFYRAPYGPGMLSVSANGTNAGTGILWASMPFSFNSFTLVPGILFALDAQNVSNELWSTGVSNYAKYVPPTVANGKVYLATFANRLNVYGLLPPSLSASLQSGSVVVTWPTNNYPAYRLQSSLDMTPGSWSDVSNSAVVTNGQFETTFPPAGVSTFYRLKL